MQIRKRVPQPEAKQLQSRIPREEGAEEVEGALIGVNSRMRQISSNKNKSEKNVPTNGQATTASVRLDKLMPWGRLQALELV
jgi:hypothetical protein